MPHEHAEHQIDPGESLRHLGEIARILMENPELQALDWSELTLAFCFDEDGDVRRTYGYAYSASGQSHPFSVWPRSVRPEVNRYREYMRLKDDVGFIKMLFQFNRISRRVKADFEYDDMSRWAVTPDNIDTIVDELKPNLD
jgi:hypothetical protein